VRLDPTNDLGCDPIKEKCISISEAEFENYLNCLDDRAMLRDQVKSLQRR